MSNHNRIAAILGAEILKGLHPAGDNLPSEPELIGRFKVSRTVIREVIKTLAAKGFVTSKTRIGTRVRDPLHWNLFDADVLAWRVGLGLDADFVRSLTEIRRAMEPAAAALAAQRRTTTDLAGLRRHVSEMARPGHTRKSFAEVDLALHLAIGVASGNPLMRSMGSVIEAALLTSFTSSSPVDNPKDHEKSVSSHAAIVDAIEARDPQAAARATLNVIDAGVRRIAARRRRDADRRSHKRRR
jgi:DNA-binding FadR family transcriptional regulator